MRPRCTKRKSFRIISGVKFCKTKAEVKASSHLYYLYYFSYLYEKLTFKKSHARAVVPKLSNS